MHPFFDYVLRALGHGAVQLLGLFGVTFLLAALLSFVSSRIRDKGAERFGLKAWFRFVALGVACHETGHALGCLLTGTKIVEFVPFRIREEGDGSVTLGYVSHATHPESRLWRMGEFLIATGPIWFGALVLTLLARGFAGADLLPPAVDMSLASSGPLDYLGNVLLFARRMLASSMAVWHWKSPWTLLYLYLSFCVATEVKLSPPDLAGMWRGLLAICTTVLALHLVPFASRWLDALYACVRPWLFVFHVLLCFALLLDLVFLAAFFVLRRLVPRFRRR